MVFSISDILVFTFAVFLLLVTPGPGVLHGRSRFWIRQPGRTGLSDWLIFRHQPGGIGRVGGYAALVLSIPYVRWVLMAGSFGYLLWLALKIAMAGRKLSWIESEKPPGIHGESCSR